MGLKMGVCGDDKRKAGVVRNDLRDAKIGFGPARKKVPGPLIVPARLRYTYS